MTVENLPLFEGIATINTIAPKESGRANVVTYDVYAKISMDRVDSLLRWHGTFEVIGSDLPQLGGQSRIELSDGLRASVIVRLEENGKGSFQGLDLPPGFMSSHPLQPVDDHTTAIASGPQTIRRVLSNTLFAGSAGLLTAGLWIDGHGWQLAGTAFIAVVAAIASSPTPTNRG